MGTDQGLILGTCWNCLVKSSLINHEVFTEHLLLINHVMRVLCDLFHLQSDMQTSSESTPLVLMYSES